MRGRAAPTPRSRLGDVLVVLGSFTLVGVLAGVLWWLLVDPAEYTKAAGGGTMGEVELGRRFAVDGWYAVIAVVGGFLTGLGLTWWRTRDLRLTTVLVVLGSALAAWVMAAVGSALGPGDVDAALEAARPGDRVPAELSVSSGPFYLMWPVGAVVGALMVLWSAPGVDLAGEEVPESSVRDPGRSMHDRDRPDRDKTVPPVP